MTAVAKTGAIKILSSMATRRIVSGLVGPCDIATGVTIDVESIGGIDAARRVRGGEAVDIVLLASDVMMSLSNDGFLFGGSIRRFARSQTAIAVRAGQPHATFRDEASLRELLAQYTRVGLSTGPSGKAVGQLLDNWHAPRRPDIVLAPPGVPVAQLIANGDVDIGFQQLSELLGEPDIKIIGPLPETILPATVFSAGLSVRASDARGARAVIEFLMSPETAHIKRAGGMEPG